MSDSSKTKLYQSPVSWFHDDAPHGPTRLTNYALLRNLIGQILTEEHLANSTLNAKILSVIDIDGAIWHRSQSHFQLYVGSISRNLKELDQSVGPVTITSIFGVPNREAEELLVIQRERAEFELAQQAEDADPDRKFQSAMESQKHSWNSAWPVGSRVRYEYETNFVWKRTISPAYWYADQLVVDLCTGRKAVPVAGLTMRDSAEVEVVKWNESHGDLAYDIEYVGSNDEGNKTKAATLVYDEGNKTKAATLAYVEDQRAVLLTRENVVVPLGLIMRSQTKADVAEKMAKIQEDIRHQMRHGRVHAMPYSPPYNDATPPMGVTLVDKEERRTVTIEEDATAGFLSPSLMRDRERRASKGPGGFPPLRRPLREDDLKDSAE